MVSDKKNQEVSDKPEFLNQLKSWTGLSVIHSGKDGCVINGRRPATIVCIVYHLTRIYYCLLSQTSWRDSVTW